MTAFTFTTTMLLQIGDSAESEWEVEVKARFIPFYPGDGAKHGPPESPPEPAHCEIDSAVAHRLRQVRGSIELRHERDGTTLDLLPLMTAENLSDLAAEALGEFNEREA